ncbi:MAG: hypothetical protein PVI30_17470 [Myxococcales bacterium]|jgi:ligand-binding sensor domain-containing protein
MLRAWMAISILCVTACQRGHAQPRVQETLGDGSETTCTAADDTALWTGTAGAGMFRRTPEGSRRYDSTRGLQGNRVHDCVMAGGALWVATERALSRFDAGRDRFETVMPGRFARLAASDRGLWAASAGGAVVRVDTGDPAGQATTRAPAETALDQALTALAADPAGGWVAGSLQGRVHFSDDRAPLRLLSRPGSEPEPVRWLSFEDGALLICTAAGVQRFDGRRLSPAGGREAARPGSAAPEPPDDPHARMPCGPRITALSVHAGALWAGSFDRGLCRYDGTRWERFAGPAHLPSDMVNDLASDGQTLMVATAAGVALVDARGRFVQRTVDDCRGRLWVATDAGLSVLRWDEPLAALQATGRTAAAGDRR